MATALLPRMTLADGLETERVKLAKQAQQKLGYTHLATQIAVPDALLYALRDLGITPFKTAHVERYMNSKKRVGMYSDTKTALLITFALGVFLSGVGIAFQHARTGPEWVRAVAVFGSIFGLLAAILTVMYWCNDAGHGTRTIRKWKRYNLSGYQDAIPEFVLQRALLIEERTPLASFYIDQLVEGEENNQAPVRQPDPFLVVTLGHESYYVDVWEEKEYEASL